MPASPAMRISPGRADNHKRGRSLESGIHYREKDDDLALFNEVQNKESDNFLLQSNDDLDDIFSTKLRYFSEGKLGISIPSRGESSDLLNAEADKNDYDWLITPPETPLFPSLDDETPPANLVTRGRPRSQPVSISRSSTMEKGYRSASRGSPSPNRLSPSPRSGTSPLQSRTKPFPSTHSSPPPTFRQSSPSRKPSPSPSPAPRSNTPTPRRMSTGSAGPTPPSKVRGTSPIKTSRGNSASPKIRAWQSNIPGFSSEAPPNLRTSLADRPASYVRGSSPASRSGSRQSMSPTASRSVSSSHSHDRDDDMDSLQSNFVSSSDRSAPRSVGSHPNSRVMGFSKKSTKVLSSSAPKRSFDLALRQMDRKGPQNMFRPLLSSVPSSTFYAGKASANHHRPLISRNSSITTSSNASSDQATSGALDTEENEQIHEDATSDFDKEQNPNLHDELFVMDQADDNALNEDIDKPSVVIPQLNVAESSSQLETATAMDITADVVSERRYDHSEAEDIEVCSICGRGFHSGELVMEENGLFCLECKSSEANSTKNTDQNSVRVLENGSLEIFDQSAPIQETDHHSCSEPSQDLVISTIEKPVDGEMGPQQLQHIVVNSNSNSNIDVSEGMGISLLLKRSSSGKGHIVQNRSLTATNISYDGFSYTRDSLNSMRSSIGFSSASLSLSSSLDMGSSKQTETTPRILRQKSDMESYKYETPPSKHKRSLSSLSGASSLVLQVPGVTPICLEDSFEDEKIGELACVDPSEQSRASECTEAESTRTDVESTSHVSILNPEEHISHEENDEILTKNSVNEEASATTQLLASSQGEDEGITEVEIENADILSADSQSDVDSTSSKRCPVELVESSVVDTIVEESDVSDHIHGVLEESTIILEDNLSGAKPRSLTLEEATDTILFCSSIVHNLAFKAANIAIDKENSEVEEIIRPAVTFVGKSNPDTRELRSRTTGKRGSKSQKTRQRKSETDVNKSPSFVSETNEKSSPRIVRDFSEGDYSMKQPPKLESKCNCTIM